MACLNISGIIKNCPGRLLRKAGFAYLWLCLAICSYADTSADNTSVNNSWLLADLTAQRLVLYNGEDHEIRAFDNISIGSGGTSKLHFRGDQTTPLGNYRVTHINYDSRYHVFIGLNYPTSSHAKYAYFTGKISERELNTLLDAARHNSVPPANTALGGMIGIHALGTASPEVHKVVNWTDGCVALNNKQMDDLLPYVHEGMRVVIR